MGEIKWMSGYELGIVQSEPEHRAIGLLSRNGESCVVAVPTSCLRDAPDSGGVREDIHETVKRQRDESRERVAELEESRQRLRSECSRLRDVLAEARIERDDARSRVAELERRRPDVETWRLHVQDWKRAEQQVRAERDEARQHAADLECELEQMRLERDELKDAECKRLAGELDTIPKDEQPTTHFKAGDEVLVNGKVVVHLVAHAFTAAVVEAWSTTECPRLLLQADSDVVLERDGIPTDAGLERLAEKAGRTFKPDVYLSDSGFLVDARDAWLDRSATDRDRRALAAALREMEVGRG